MQKTTLATMFGPITINRRIYRDRDEGGRVALLDKYLGYDGGDSLSSLLTDVAVRWAIKVPPYRNARDRFFSMLGLELTGRAWIGEDVLKLNQKEMKLEESD